MDKAIRDKYFGDTWHPDWDHYKYSGWALLDKIEPEEEIRNFNNNFDSRVLDFAKPNTRKVLASTDFDMSAIDPEDFVVEYLAYQRLHNRSEKRCLKNKGELLSP